VPSRSGIGMAALLLAMLPAVPALAHTAGVSPAGFAAGFFHPLSGFDHLLAMVSIGIWGAELGAPAIWLLPIAFPLIMAVGGALGIVGIPLPGGELLIALSVVVLGVAVASAVRVPVWTALSIAGVFAIAHGHAHGVELPYSADALAFTIGFVIATGLLHLAGIAIGLSVRWPQGVVAIRTGGAAIAAAGCYFLYQYAGA